MNIYPEYRSVGILKKEVIAIIHSLFIFIIHRTFLKSCSFVRAEFSSQEHIVVYNYC